MRKKLLLADDSITIQKVVELTFPSTEFEVVTAGNGRLAIDKAMTFLPDMVLCDVIMPQLDGYQVCEALRASPELKDVPILLLNGAFEPYDAERARAVGALGNVSKPFDPPALVARVKEILATRGTHPMSLEDLTELAKPQAPEAAVHATTEIRAHTGETYAYASDESEIQPVSTVEASLDVRTVAARSLALDAPVFTQAEPEVLSGPDAPPDFSETLHDPLETSPPAQDSLARNLGEEMAAVEEFTPITSTGETATPRMEFHSSSGGTERELPSTVPPVFAAHQALTIEPFSHEHEFEPEVETHEGESTSSGMANRLPAPEQLATSELMAPMPKTAAASVASPAAKASPAPASLPSAEVAVPVDMVQQIAQRVISQVSERVIHEIAWDVIPGLAEKLIKAEIERIKARAESEHD